MKLKFKDYLKLIKKYLKFENIPDNEKSEEICLMYVYRCMSRGEKINFNVIPSYIKTEKFYMKIVENDPDVIYQIDENIVNKKMWLCFTSEIGNIHKVPEKYLTYDFYYYSIKMNRYNIEEIPENFFDDKMIKHCLEVDVRNIYEIDSDKLKYEHYLFTAKKDPNFLEIMPSSLITKKIYKLCLNGEFVINDFSNIFFKKIISISFYKVLNQIFFKKNGNHMLQDTFFDDNIKEKTLKKNISYYYF
jgi:hypothetical protein